VEGELWFWLPGTPKDATQDDKAIPVQPAQQAGENIYRVGLNFFRTTRLHLGW
jgi:hypothetical protein